MKIALLLCTLILSLHGRCASVISSPHTARAITSSRHAVENARLQAEGSRSLLVDKMKTAMIGWGLIIYITAIISWAIIAKNSLDRILKDVLQGIAQYS